jgi:hypothetical protein
VDGFCCSLFNEYLRKGGNCKVTCLFCERTAYPRTKAALADTRHRLSPFSTKRKGLRFSVARSNAWMDLKSVNPPGGCSSGLTEFSTRGLYAQTPFSVFAFHFSSPDSDSPLLYGGWVRGKLCLPNPLIYWPQAREESRVPLPLYISPTEPRPRWGRKGPFTTHTKCLRSSVFHRLLEQTGKKSATSLLLMHYQKHALRICATCAFDNGDLRIDIAQIAHYTKHITSFS